jgi:hypothetical protein
MENVWKMYGKRMENNCFLRTLRFEMRALSILVKAMHLPNFEVASSEGALELRSWILGSNLNNKGSNCYCAIQMEGW